MRWRSIEKPEESLKLKHINAIAIVPVPELKKVLLMELVGAVYEEETSDPAMINMNRKMRAYNLVSFCISKKCNH